MTATVTDTAFFFLVDVNQNYFNCGHYPEWEVRETDLAGILADRTRSHREEMKEEPYYRTVFSFGVGTSPNYRFQYTEDLDRLTEPDVYIGCRLFRSREEAQAVADRANRGSAVAFQRYLDS